MEKDPFQSNIGPIGRDNSANDKKEGSLEDVITHALVDDSHAPIFVALMELDRAKPRKEALSYALNMEGKTWEEFASISENNLAKVTELLRDLLSPETNTTEYAKKAKEIVKALNS